MLGKAFPKLDDDHLQLRKYHEKQRESMIQQFTNDMTRCLMAMPPRKLGLFSKCYGWEFVPLARTRNENALVLLTENDYYGKSRRPELWVRRRYTGYRKAFKRFLAEYEGIELSSSFKWKNWQVDHVMNRSYFKGRAVPYYIRLALIEREVNASFGGGFEKLFSARERVRRPDESGMGGFHIHWIVLLKILGIKLPSSTKSEVWQDWLKLVAKRIARIVGTDFRRTYDGIGRMLNSGYTGAWQPLPWRSDGI